MFDNPKGGGLAIPQHILSDRRSQEQAVAQMMMDGYNSAYKETLGRLQGPAAEFQQLFSLAASFLNSRISADGFQSLGEHDTDLRSLGEYDIEVSWALARQFMIVAKQELAGLHEKLEAEVDEEPVEQEASDVAPE